MSDNNEEEEVKVILLGDCGVGKTNIISRYTKNEFRQNSLSTNGASYANKMILIDGMKYPINIWDTAGQEKYRSVTKMFIQDTNVLILCYSITDRKSFESLEYWYKTATDICGENIVIGVAGNKSDLFEEEVVKDEEGTSFAENHKAIFKLVSAMTGKEGIDELFELLIKEYVRRKKGSGEEGENNKEENSKGGVKIQDNSGEKKKKKKCC